LTQFSAMPGTSGKCSHCQRSKEKAKIECSSCKQWFSYCCAGVLAGNEVVVSVTTPFSTAANARPLAGNSQAHELQFNVTIAIAKQTQGGS